MNIIVTGANKGIGLSLVKKYCDLKFNVFAFSRSIDNLKKIKLKHDNFNYISFDLEKGDYDKELMPSIKKHMRGKVDVVINNAGFLVNKKMLDLSKMDIVKSFQINVFSIFSLIKSIDGFLKSGSHIINISSLGGVPYTKKLIGLSAYSSSKAAVTVLTECFAEEFKERGILCNCFALGAVKTDMLKKAFPSFKGGESVDFVAKEIVDFSISKDKLLTGKIINLASSF